MSHPKPPSRFKRVRHDEEEQKYVRNGEDYADYMSHVETFLDIPHSQVQENDALCSGQSPLSSKKSQKLLMQESRIQGMSMPLSSSNKGFILLQKKGGFVEGHGLGKDEQGILSPLGVEVRDKKDMAGLGVAAAKHRRQEVIDARKSEWTQLRDQIDATFRNSLAKHHADNKLKKHLQEAVKVIHRLDLERGWFSHELTEIYDELITLKEAGYVPSSSTSQKLIFKEDVRDGERIR